MCQRYCCDTQICDRSVVVAQAENHLDYLIWAKRLTHLKRLGRVISAQATTTERSQICLSQQYRWHMMIEAEWEDIRRTNSPRDIFIRYAHFFSVEFG